MTLQLCVIGNSHLAALKLGWDQLAAEQHPVTAQIAPVFFGAPRDSLRHVAIRGGKIVPTKGGVGDFFQRMSGGLAEIDLDAYDAILLVGLGASMKRLLRLYKTHVWHGLAAATGKTVLPRAFVLEFLTERYGTTRLCEMARLIGGACDLPLFAVAEPHWASWARDGVDGSAEYGWGKAAAAGDGPPLGHLFHEAMVAALTARVSFLPQPPETLSDGIMTQDRFNKDASRLISGVGGGTDAAHMNGDFGAAFWPLIAGALADRQAAA